MAGDILTANNDQVATAARGGIETINLLTDDDAGEVVLGSKTTDWPADFADLTLVMLSARMYVAEILFLDSDSGDYRCFCPTQSSGVPPAELLRSGGAVMGETPSSTPSKGHAGQSWGPQPDPLMTHSDRAPCRDRCTAG